MIYDLSIGEPLKLPTPIGGKAVACGIMPFKQAYELYVDVSGIDTDESSDILQCSQNRPTGDR